MHVGICERQLAIHCENFSKKRFSQKIMIPDRLISSQKFSVEGVLLSSNEVVTKRQLTLTVFEVIEEDVEALALVTIVLDDNA